MARKKSHSIDWYTIDLHIHTPASSDFQQSGITYLQLLQRAEARGLDVIAFTDHNTVAGYRKMQDEIHQLEVLEQLNRLLPDEQVRLNEYKRLMAKILVLPGFELTATFGFHILAIFPAEKSVREIEHLLMNLAIPTDQLDDGSANVGATTDVLTAYRMMSEAGALVIAAHANSSNGVAMRGFPMGGQTKIAYTQDLHLHALEVTDLEQHGPRSTASFFNGTKPEYPRRMHCIQGSDSHRLTADTQRKKVFGLGDRATDVSLPEVSFAALKDLFLTNDFARTRPHRLQAEPAYDFIRTARDEGNNIIQSFHERATVRGGSLYAILADACAYANANGGTMYIGLHSNPSKPIVGVTNPEQVVAQLEKEFTKRITPPLIISVDVHETSDNKVLRVLVPRGDDPPYVLDDYKVYIRNEAETELAVRDEIVSLVLRGQKPVQAEPVVEGKGVALPVGVHAEKAEMLEPPRTGVEVVAVDERDGSRYYTLRDLRNGNVVKNVTQSSARRLWHYAIKQHARLPGDLSKAKIKWDGDQGLLRQYKEGKQARFDLIQRTPDSNRFYFGVTEDGIHGRWKVLIGGDAGSEDD